MSATATAPLPPVVRNRPEKPAAEAAPAPAAAQPAPEVVMPAKGPALGGRIPRVGDTVIFWGEMGNRLIPQPAWLFAYSEIHNAWTINIQLQGTMRKQNDVPFSDKPAQFHWSWRDEPTSTIAGEVPVMVPVYAALEAKIAEQGQRLSAMGEEIAVMRAEMEALRKPAKGGKKKDDVPEGTSNPPIGE